MSDFLIKSLPRYYRLNLSEKLAVLIKQGRSINIIGMPAVGKNTYINFFLENRSSFLESNYKFVTINIREFAGKNIEDFKKFLVLKLGNQNPNGDTDETLKKISSEKETYIIFRYLDELNKELLNLICKYLLVLRQQPYQFRYIFLSNRPISEKIEDESVRSRLFGTEEYFKPSSTQDYDLEIEAYEKFLGIPIGYHNKKKLYELTGGHGGYTKLVLGYEKEKLLKYLESDLYDLVTTKKDLPKELQVRSQEILKILKKDEVESLNKLVRGELIKVPQLVEDLGLITRDEKNKPRLFSLILLNFLQSQA